MTKLTFTLRTSWISAPAHGPESYPQEILETVTIPLFLLPAKELPLYLLLLDLSVHRVLRLPILLCMEVETRPVTISRNCGSSGPTTVPLRSRTRNGPGSVQGRYRQESTLTAKVSQSNI